MSVALSWRTPATWAPAALGEPLALLSDHASCELGAASTAQTLIARHPGRAAMVDALGALAAEELRHFRRVHALLVRLGGALEPVRENPYAVGLVRAVDRAAPAALVDRLLVSALIEARSHERFGLLAEAAADGGSELAPLARLFEALGPAEEGHARLFVDLAADLASEVPEAAGPVDVEARLARWAEHEARLVRSLPFAPRVHSGPPVAAPLPRLAREVEA